MSFTNETDKQKYYIEKCRELIAAKETETWKKVNCLCCNIRMSDEF